MIIYVRQFTILVSKHRYKILHTLFVCVSVLITFKEQINKITIVINYPLFFHVVYEILIVLHYRILKSLLVTLIFWESLWLLKFWKEIKNFRHQVTLYSYCKIIKISFLSEHILVTIIDYTLNSIDVKVIKNTIGSCYHYVFGFNQ